MAEKGSSFDPPQWCNICREELFVATYHPCSLPIEGTAAWYDPEIEKEYMAHRHEWLGPKNVGDVTRPHGMIELGPVREELPSAEE